MAWLSCVKTKHATLTSTTADTVRFTGGGRTLRVTNRHSSNVLYASHRAANETQTITLSAGAENDTFKLTWNGNESSALVTIPAGGYANVTAAQIAACLATITGVTATDVSVTKASNDYPVVFIGTLAGTDVTIITITTKTGAANGSVAETNKGGCVAAADETFSIMPLSWKDWTPKGSAQFADGFFVSVVGNANPYSVELL